MNCPGAAARRISIAGAFRIVEQFGVLDHDDRIGAARHHAAGRNRGGAARRNRDRRRMTAGDHLAIERKPARRAVARTRGVGRAQRKAVDAGTVEGRHVDRRSNVGGEHATERVGKRYRFDPARREVDMTFEALPGLLGRDHFEELLLSRGAAHRIDQGGFGVRIRRLTAAASPSTA